MPDLNFKYNQPWIYQRADPYIYRHTDGWYYFSASVPEYDRVILRRSRTLFGLAEAEERIVWKKHDFGPMSYHVWAPELHYIMGKWVIYFAAGEKDDVWKIRPYILECAGDDPYQDPWQERGMLIPAEGDCFSFQGFSLDATVFQVRKEHYVVWAEKVGVGKQISNLYIAKLKSPFELSTVQVLLTTPDYAWERFGFWVNEGPAILMHDHQIYLTYSASDTGIHYCLGMLTADMNDDLLDPRSWKKSSTPVLETDASLGIYGPGHNSFTKDEAGNDILVYHARTSSQIVENPLYNPDRHTMLMKIRWSANNNPIFSYYEES